MIVFTNGDATSQKTWSNVPFNFTKSLMDEGCVVHCVDISQLGWIPKLYEKLLNGFMRTFLKRVYGETHWNARRTIVYAYCVHRKMKKALNMYPNSKIAISLTYSYLCPAQKGLYTVMLCDWPLWYLYERECMKKSLFDRFSIRLENREIMRADEVISLYPYVASRMCSYYKKHVCYLGNYINADLQCENLEAVIEKKYESNEYIFIGKKEYGLSARFLIDVLSKYQIENPQKKFKVIIIGLNSDFFEEIPQNIDIVFLGYLNKSDETQKSLYYKNLLKAKAIVNTTDKWAGPSSIFEAMYLGTPVITLPNKDFLMMVGEKRRIGYYCESNTFESVYNAIKYIDELSEVTYKEMGVQAHEAVKNYTWSNYAKNFVKLMCEKGTQL